MKSSDSPTFESFVGLASGTFRDCPKSIELSDNDGACTKSSQREQFCVERNGFQCQPLTGPDNFDDSRNCKTPTELYGENNPLEDLAVLPVTQKQSSGCPLPHACQWVSVDNSVSIRKIHLLLTRRLHDHLGIMINCLFMPSNPFFIIVFFFLSWER